LDGGPVAHRKTQTKVLANNAFLGGKKKTNY